MRLTVGPLPAAVYWRRRGVVLVGLAMVVLIISYAFSGPDGSANTNVAPTPSASATTTGEVPSTGTSTALPSSASPSASASAFTLPVAGATGPCTDAEMEVTASAPAAEVTRNQPVAFTIKIKNISSRTCVRDVGADVQELLLKDDATTIWSSDDCDANHGQDLKQFTPGFEVSYTRTWMGFRSRGGNNTVECGSLAPDPKVYQLFARLDKKLSPPFALTINPS
jgi:hypothetical protein